MFLRLSDLFPGVEVNGRNMNIHWLFQESFASLTLPYIVQNKTQTGKLLRVKNIIGRYSNSYKERLSSKIIDLFLMV